MARVDGACPIKTVDGDGFMTPADVADLRAEIGRRRHLEGFDIAVAPGPPPRAAGGEFKAAGATWLFIGSNGQERWEDDVAALIGNGPGVFA